MCMCVCVCYVCREYTCFVCVGVYIEQRFLSRCVQSECVSFVDIWSFLILSKGIRGGDNEVYI